MLPDGRPKAILILLAGAAFVALGLYQMSEAWATEENPQIICGAEYELINGKCVAAFEEETKDVVIEQLIAENNRVIAENIQLKQDNYEMSLLLADMQKEIENLNAIILEQIRVMMTHFK